MAGKNGKDTNIHAMHRQRVKKKFQQIGLADHPEHEILEFLLYYCIPYKDTNPLAHDLINRYGSLAGVLDASYYDLLKVPGVGEHTALFLTSLPQVLKYYTMTKWDEAPYFASPEIYGAYAVNLFMDLTKEEFYICCLNAAGRLIKSEKLGSGSLDAVNIYIREAVEIVLRHKAKYVILMHNHPSGNLLPSAQDLMLTQNLWKAFNNLNIDVIDHVIVGGGKYFSFKEQDLPLKGYTS